jgi:hypothetical protein
MISGSVIFDLNKLTVSGLEREITQTSRSLRGDDAKNPYEALSRIPLVLLLTSAGGICSFKGLGNVLTLVLDRRKGLDGMTRFVKDHKSTATIQLQFNLSSIVDRDDLRAIISDLIRLTRSDKCPDGLAFAIALQQPTGAPESAPTMTRCSWLTLKRKVYLYLSEVLHNAAIDVLPPMPEIWVNGNGDMIHTHDAYLVDMSRHTVTAWTQELCKKVLDAVVRDRDHRERLHEDGTLGTHSPRCSTCVWRALDFTLRMKYTKSMREVPFEAWLVRDLGGTVSRGPTRFVKEAREKEQFRDRQQVTF